MMIVKSYNELGRAPMIGDRVRIVDKRVGANWNPQGLMDKYFGTVMTVSYVYGFSSPDSYSVRLKESLANGEHWIWYSHMIEGLVMERIEDIEEDPSTWISDVAFDALLS